MILGRPKGKTSETSKLDGAEIGTTIMLMHGISINRIAKLYGVHRNTVKLFIKRKKLDSKANIQKVVNLCG
jgi:transposase